MEAGATRVRRKQRQVEFALEQARYEAAGRAVNTTRWILTTAWSLPSWSNAGTSACSPSARSKDERDALAAMPANDAHRGRARTSARTGRRDVEGAWHSPGATPATRKRIIRTLIEEIVVRVEDDALAW